VPRNKLELIDLLATDLTLAERGFGQPMILECPVLEGLPSSLTFVGRHQGVTGHFDVMPVEMIDVAVFWDRFIGCTSVERTAIVREAYVRAVGEKKVLRHITGLSVLDAQMEGHLPYQITAYLRPEDRITRAQVKQLFLDHGGTVLADSTGSVGLFLTCEQDARLCVDSLLRACPESGLSWWGINRCDPGRVLYCTEP
jgi:hypothetical protein